MSIDSVSESMHCRGKNGIKKGWTKELCVCIRITTGDEEREDRDLSSKTTTSTTTTTTTSIKHGCLRSTFCCSCRRLDSPPFLHFYSMPVRNALCSFILFVCPQSIPPLCVLEYWLRSRIDWTARDPRVFSFYSEFPCSTLLLLLLLSASVFFFFFPFPMLILTSLHSFVSSLSRRNPLMHSLAVFASFTTAHLFKQRMMYSNYSVNCV